VKTIVTFNRLDEAFLARSRLEGAGVKAFIPDEITASSSGNNLWGAGGVRLMVEDEDLDRAREVLGIGK
jgi:hypothetical protein